MTSIAVASASGAPGASTLAAAIAALAARNTVTTLIEADEAGGTFAARWNLGTEPGLVDLATALRREIDASAVGRVAQRVAPNLKVVPSPTTPETVAAALATCAARLGSALREVEGLVVLDCGRVDRRAAVLETLRSLDLVLLVVDPDLPHNARARSRCEALDQVGVRTHLVTTGNGPYEPDDVARHLGVALFAPWSHDPVAASEFWVRGASSKRVLRSSWWRSTVELGDRALEFVNAGIRVSV